MHDNLPFFFVFIDSFDEKYIRKLNKKVAIIYRNYSVKYNKELICKIKDSCKKNKIKFFLANDLRLATNLGLDGVYLPSFNKSLNISKTNMKKKFLIIGSAHTIQEIKNKELQGATAIFIAPLLKTKKNKKFLNIIKFNLLGQQTRKKIIALGGITDKNLKKVRMTKSYGFAGISYFKGNNHKTIKI
jgi:thiamine-phosphate pyrophosphorylase